MYRRLKSIAAKDYEIVDAPPPVGKDVNDFCCPIWVSDSRKPIVKGGMPVDCRMMISRKILKTTSNLRRKARNYPMKNMQLLLQDTMKRPFLFMQILPNRRRRKSKLFSLTPTLFLFPRKILSAEKPRLRTQIRKMERKKICPMKMRTSV